MEETQKNEEHQVKHVAHNEPEESTLTLKKSTLWKIATFLFAGLFIISLFTGGFGLKAPTGQVVEMCEAALVNERKRRVALVAYRDLTSSPGQGIGSRFSCWCCCCPYWHPTDSCPVQAFFR